MASKRQRSAAARRGWETRKANERRQVRQMYATLKKEVAKTEKRREAGRKGAATRKVKESKEYKKRLAVYRRGQEEEAAAEYWEVEIGMTYEGAE